jgi:hypothetical protein
VDPYQLGYRLKTIVAEILPVDGHLFVNHLELPVEELRSRVAAHAGPGEAQLWMNIVLLDDFISEACGDNWEDADAEQVLDVVVLAWRYQIQAKYPKANVRIERVSDAEYGDLGLRLVGTVD